MTYLLIAEKIKRRSLIFLFTDMFQVATDQEKLFEALQHLKYNKHEVILFHVFDKDKELKFDYENKMKCSRWLGVGLHVVFMVNFICLVFPSTCDDDIHWVQQLYFVAHCLTYQHQNLQFEPTNFG